MVAGVLLGLVMVAKVWIGELIMVARVMIRELVMVA